MNDVTCSIIRVKFHDVDEVLRYNEIHYVKFYREILLFKISTPPPEIIVIQHVSSTPTPFLQREDIDDAWPADNEDVWWADIQDAW